MVTVDDGKAGRTGPPFSGKARTWKVADKGEQATNGYIGVLFNGTEDGEATALQAPSKTALASAAPEFVPRAGASEFVPRAAAAAFVPRMGSTTGSATATEFVPGNSSWGWQQANNWPPGRRAGTASASGAWPWSGTSQSQPSQSGNCWFNQDAYSTGSSSPRDSDAGEDFSRLASHEVKPEATEHEEYVSPRQSLGGSPARARHNAGNDPSRTTTGAAAAQPAEVVDGSCGVEEEEDEEEVFHDANEEPEPQKLDMTESNMKAWLQQFADLKDSDALLQQWRAWKEEDANSTSRVTAWLLRRAFDDCRCAGPIIGAIQQLVLHDEANLALVESGLAEYSDDVLEDIKLDNPKADDFVSELRKVLAGPCSASPSATTDVKPPQGNSDGVVAPGEPQYSRASLLSARLHMLASASCEEPSARWHTKAASALFEPAGPRHGKHAQDLRSSCEWRRGESGGRPGEARPRRGSDARGRDKEAHSKESISVSEASWVAQTRRRKEEQEQSNLADVADEQFVREMRATLNKLTIDKFEQLSAKIVDLIADSRRPNRGIPILMQMIFEKATTQHHFITMYVNLCVKVHRWLTEHEEIVPTESQTNFKRILLNQCQTSFEQYLELPEGLDGLTGDELYEAQVKYKTRMLGNIKLVGELIRHGMLSSKIAISVAEELAMDDLLVRDERLETLAVFLEAIGPALDRPNWAHQKELEAIFLKIQRFIKDTTLPCRIRFLLRDVLDLRHGEWNFRKPKSADAEAPSTIAEVHQRAHSSMTPQSCRSGHDDSLASRGRRRSGPSRGCGSNGSSRERASDAQAPRTCPPSPASSSKPSPQLGPKTQPQAWQASPARRPAAVTQHEPSLPPTLSLEAPSKQELLVAFHKEIASTIRQIGNSLTVAAAIAHLRRCPVPPECMLEETADLLARLVDEPRARREKLFAFLAALFADGVFSPPKILGEAVESFVQDAFEEPDCVDPPDLADIVLNELLPSLQLAPGSLRLPHVLSGAAVGT